MVLHHLTSKQVLEFLPLNTWTEVHLLQSELKNVYVVTTKEKMEKRKKDMETISLESSLYDKVTQFETFKIVAVEIGGKWFRGKLISFNEFLADNTIRLELIDYGSVYETQLENLFVLPYYFMYESLVLPVTFKNFIPKVSTFSIKPLLSESNLHEGSVLVDVNCNDIKLENCVNEKKLLESKKDINSANDSKIIGVINNITNAHDRSSLYPYRTFRKDSFISEKKLNNVPFKNEDYCILTYFEDFTCLYVGKAIKCDNNGSYNFVDYDTLLNTAKSTDKVLKLYPVVGDVVKVFSSKKDGLYRAKILKNNKGCYDVFYIDFGNIETVPSDVIYELADELKKPGIAVKIGLSDLKDIQTTEQIKNMFQTFCDGRRPLVIELNENSKNCLENVKLRDLENGSYINSKYLMKCTLTQTEESIQKEQNITENETVSINTPELEVISNIELKTGDIVFCTHFEAFDHLYICKCSKNNTTPDNYKVIINSKMTNDIILKKDPKYKDKVRVKFEEKIFRAEVLKKCGKKYSVFLIDIGKNIDVLGDNIYELPNDLKNIPGLALKVGLKGTIGLKITADVNNYFSQLWRKNQPVPLILRFDEFNFNYLNEISLIKKRKGRDIIDDLVRISNGSIKVLNNWKSGDLVEVLCGDNVDSILVRKIKLYEEFKNVLDQLKKENIEHYKPIAAKKGDFVAVYSENFNRHVYRARVLKPDFDNPNIVKCNLIDFGKTDIIPSKYLFPLPDYVLLNKIPTIVCKVSLIGLTMISNDKIIPYLDSLKGKTYVMEYDQKPGPCPRPEVVLRELQSGVSLNDEIQVIFK